MTRMAFSRAWLAMLSMTAVCLSSSSDAAAVCHVVDVSRTAVIKEMGGKQTKQLLKVYRTEGYRCYIGNHGSSFGPFQLHYGGRHNSQGNRSAGLGEVFTRQTGLNARNPNTVPAQILFMKRWGTAHGGFSSNIWHGLRHRRVGSHHGHRHWRHHRPNRPHWRH